MILSIRGRLTLWYAGILAVILILFSGGVYAGLARTLQEVSDRRLFAGLDEISIAFRHELSERVGKVEGEEYFQSVLISDHQTTLPAQLVLVYEGERLVGIKPPIQFAGRAISLLNNPQKRPLQGAELWSEHNWRVVAREMWIAASHTRYRIILAESEQPINDELARLRRVFLLVVPIGVLLSAVSGYLLARKSLAPVVAMSEAVEQISSRNLERRIPSGNPKDELGKLAATFNELLARLERAFDQQRRFMADASHELRTPLSISHTAAQVTMEKPSREESEYREALKVIDKQVVRLTHLVEDMFLLAQADAGGVPLRITSFYLDELLMEASRAAEVLGSRKSVRVSMIPASETLFSGDETLIRQMVMILLDNSVKYTPEGGIIELKLEQSPDSLTILVSDTGAGIPMDARPHLFERFFRVDGSRSRMEGETDGAGLGLSIALWIAEAHHGEVSLRSSGEGGNVFAIVVPRPGA